MSAEPALDRDLALELLRSMTLIRRFEEACAEQYSAGKIRGFLHLYIGEEAVAAGVFQHLRAEDKLVTTYREHGHALARGMDPGAIMAEMFGKANGCSRGRGGSMHLFDSALNFYGGHAIVGGGLPVAVGIALADHMRGERAVTACFFGDGAVDEGEFHESMNMASLWGLPVLFICENNQYAMGTALERHQSEVHVCRKAEAYEVTAESVDGMDVQAVAAATRRATEAIRETGRPYFLEFRTYRFRAHSMYDAEKYRDHHEVEEWKKRGPILRFRAVLEEAGLLKEGDVEAIEARVAEQVSAAVAFAEAGELEPIAELHRDVLTPKEARP